MVKIKIPVWNDITEEYENEMKEFDTENLDPNGDRFDSVKDKKIKETKTPSKNPAFESFEKMKLTKSFDDFIVLKNASDDYWNDPIILNKKHITSIFGNPGNGRTSVYCGYSGQNWEVQEDLKTIVKLIKG